MGDTGQKLGVDLYELLKVAKDHLPTISGEYSTAIGGFDKASTDVAAAMSRPAYFGGDSLGPAHPAYLEFSGAIEAYLATMRITLDDTSTVLLQAIKAYTDTDAEAAARFNSLRTQHEPVPQDTQ